MGEFTTNYLAESGHRIPIIGKISINGSVQFLGIPDFVRDSGFSFIENLLSLTKSGIPKNGTLPLIEIFPMIGILCPLSAR